MNIFNNINKDNIHHAYLVEGAKENILPQFFGLCDRLCIKTVGNPDFCHITIDNFKIEDANMLRSMSLERGVNSDAKGFLNKKIFLICANKFSLDATGVLLKMFEEPIENTHFFLIMPDVNTLGPTLISRFYFLQEKSLSMEKEAKQFLSMPIIQRLEFLKELLEDNEEEDVSVDSARSRTLIFLNSLEAILHNEYKMASNYSEIFKQIFKVREYLRQPGASAKSLIESLALLIPQK